MNTSRTSACPQIEEQKRECEKVIDEIVKRHTQACRQEAAPWIALRARLSTYDVVTVVLDSSEAVDGQGTTVEPPESPIEAIADVLNAAAAVRDQWTHKHVANTPLEWSVVRLINKLQDYESMLRRNGLG